MDFASLGGFDVMVLVTLAEAVLEPFPELVLETIFFAGTFETFFPTALETGLAAVFPRVLGAFRLVTETFFAWDCFATLVFEAVFLAVVLVGFGLAEGFDFLVSLAALFEMDFGRGFFLVMILRSGKIQLSQSFARTSAQRGETSPHGSTATSLGTHLQLLG
ncbi:MAG: hypothetical protein VXX28_11105, partial [Verrucomicrobiota bacterium]|nr:hypothetical protein [Verrucomicrobiota bacterium]